MAKLRPISPFRLSSLLRQEKNPKFALQLFLSPNPNPNPKPFRHSLLSYDLIITKLGRAKLFPELDHILDRLKLETRFVPPEIIFCNLITFYANAGLPNKAIETYDMIPSFRCQRTAKSLNSLLNGMLVCREFDVMRRIFMGFERFACPDACSYNVMIRGFRVLGDLEGARKVFDEMSVRGVCPDEVTYRVMIEVLCEGFRLKEAFELKKDAQRVYGMSACGFVYLGLVKGLCKIGEVMLAIKMKDEMLEKNMEVKPVVYASLIRGLFGLGRRDEAMGILEEMEHNGCRPDTGTYNALVAGFCKEQDFESALRSLGEMNKKKLKPYVTTCNILLQGYCKGRNLTEAIDLFEDMPRLCCNPDEVSYRILLGGLLGDLKLEDASTLLDEMIRKGFHPTCSSICKFTELLIQQGNLELLLIVLNNLAKGNHVDANTWSMAISTACKNELKLNPGPEGVLPS